MDTKFHVGLVVYPHPNAKTFSVFRGRSSFVITAVYSNGFIEVEGLTDMAFPPTYFTADEPKRCLDDAWDDYHGQVLPKNKKESLAKAGLSKVASSSLTTENILDIVKDIHQERGKQRDREDGERSMELAVEIFSKMTGVTMTEAQGWKFMIALKFSRMAAGGFNFDDYLDTVGYAALLTECVAKERI